MQIYLVGGAVRDKLMGIPVKEKDWVVVGSTPEAMIALGYQPVGKAFPVFLHPETHEEYALARTERKIGKGYKGFQFHAAPDVTLIEDLQRRDLTINAMAESPHGTLIDPYHGQHDIKNKILRHVSAAFQEDPVRILRLARFSAQFPDFTVHPDTLKLMHKMVAAGEVHALVAERVWQELARALVAPQPIQFFNVLAQARALPILFPEIQLHSPGMNALARATEISLVGNIRWAALLHDMPEKSMRLLIQRYRIPNEYSDLALLVAKQGMAYQTILTADAPSLLSFITATDALRRPQRFTDFLITTTACYPELTSKHQDTVLKAIQAIQSVDIAPLQASNLVGTAFANALREQRIAAIQHSLRDY